MPKYSENSFNVSEKIECDEQFGATKCFNDGEWIGGIHPKTSDSENLLFRCCRNSEMKKAKFQKAFDLQINDNEFVGGDVYERGKLIGFDYISNIVQFENEQGINYEIFVNRISCINNNFINSTLIAIKPDFELDSDKNDFERHKLFQSLLAENPNTINNVIGLENINTQNEAGLEG
uniref:YopX protein domain-containing protein n=1 Tax=Panagrolaimus davidi TaxID=227884 RepID=A0A914PMH9_9BILA